MSPIERLAAFALAGQAAFAAGGKGKPLHPEFEEWFGKNFGARLHLIQAPLLEPDVFVEFSV